MWIIINIANRYMWIPKIEWKTSQLNGILGLSRLGRFGGHRCFFDGCIGCGGLGLHGCRLRLLGGLLLLLDRNVGPRVGAPKVACGKNAEKSCMHLIEKNKTPSQTNQNLWQK